MNRKNRVRALLLVPPILLYLAACVLPREIRIGVSLGPAYLSGIELAVDEINGGGGIMGRKLVLEIDRSGGNNNAALAIKTASGFAADRRILAVIGHDTSTASLAASPVYNNAGLVQLTPMSTSPLLSRIGPWTFQVCVDDTRQGEALANHAFDVLGKRKTFIFRVGDSYGKGLAAHFRERFVARGGTIVYQAIYTEEKPDLEPYLQLLARFEPDLIFFAGRVETLITLGQEMAKLGIAVPVLGGDALHMTSAIEENGSLLEGLMMTLFFHPSSGEPGAADFALNYRKRFGSTPDARSALAYDATYLLKAAIEAGGTERKMLRESVRSVASLHKRFAGVSGPLAFDENGRPQKPLQIGIVRGGKIMPAAIK